MYVENSLSPLPPWHTYPTKKKKNENENENERKG